MTGMALAIVGFAQPDVTTAYNLNKEMKYEEAATYIDKAITDPKASAKVKTWRYRGIIYFNMANDPALAAKYPKAIQTSQESFFKSMELDPTGEYLDDTTANLNDLQALVLNGAQNS